MHLRRAALGLLSTTTLVLTSMVALASPASAEDTTAAQLLSQLSVATESGTAYDRDFFEHWIDADGNGCDTRREVLIAESEVPVTVSAGCTVSGQWTSWYDGATWTDPAAVDVDHFVPLAEAWQSGAHAWTSAQRRDFANDLGLAQSLEAVTDTVNASKGAGDPAEWLPPLPETHCRYAQSWVQVKYRWSLTIDTTEQDTLTSLLSGVCGTATITVPAKAITAAPPAPPTQPVTGSQLNAGQTLVAGTALTSGNGRYRAVMQTDGNFVVYSPTRVLWHSRTNDNPGARVTLQGDGNFVLYSVTGRPLWHTRTNDRAGDRVVMQDDGNLVLYNTSDRALWASGPDRSTPPPAPAPSGNTLSSGQTLLAGQGIRSTNGRYRFVMQSDGNTVVYSPTRAIWTSRTGGNSGARLAMQTDGNVVVYAGTGRVLWHSRTNRYPGARLVMQDDGNLVAYSGSRPVWYTGADRTGAPAPAPAPPPPSCSSAYPDFCIPPPPPDLDCAEVRTLPGFRAGFRVLAPDPHRLDGTDNDGRGCENP